MAAHIFTLETWFMNREEDWDCEYEYLVVQDGSLQSRTHAAGATYYRDLLRYEFPDAVWHGESLSIHRGLMEPHGLRELDEEVLAPLAQRYRFKEPLHCVLQ